MTDGTGYLLETYTPTLGQVFTFMTFGSVSGDFSDYSDLWIGDRLYFKPVLEGSSYKLVVSELPGGIRDISAEPGVRDDLLALLAGKTAADVSISGSIELADFVTISGAIGFKKQGDAFLAAAEDVTTRLSAGSFSTGVEKGDFVLVFEESSRVVYAAGDFHLSGGDFLNSAGTITVLENNTGATFVAQTVTVGSVSVAVPELAAGLQSVSGTNLSFDVYGFVSLSGNLGFKKSWAEIIAVGSDVTAALTAGRCGVRFEGGSGFDGVRVEERNVCSVDRRVGASDGRHGAGALYGCGYDGDGRYGSDGRFDELHF